MRSSWKLVPCTTHFLDFPLLASDALSNNVFLIRIPLKQKECCAKAIISFYVGFHVSKIIVHFDSMLIPSVSQAIKIVLLKVYVG